MMNRSPGAHSSTDFETTVAILDGDGVIVDVNQAWRDFADENRFRGADHGVGTDYLSVCRQAMGDFCDGAIEVAQGLEDVLAGRRAEFVWEYPCPAPNRPRWYLLLVTPLRTQQGPGAQVAHIPITTRKETELRLAESEQRYRGILENMQDTYFRTDAEGRIEMVSPSVEQLLGCRGEDLVGRPMEALCVDPQAWHHLRAEVESGSGSVTDQRTPLRRAVGGEVWVSANARQVRAPDGGVVGMEGTARDITEQRRMEHELRQSHKIEALGRLTGGVAHEFNNLLMVIIGYLERGMGQLSDENARKFFSASLRAAMRGAELTSQLLAFSRKQELQVGRVSLTELVGDMRDMLQRTIGESIDVETRLDDRTWPVLLDAGQMEGALLNLALNARDAMPRGGRITISTRNTTLDSLTFAARPTAAPGDYVVLEVADTGIGMPREVVERAFEPFYTTKEVGEGTGLGLSMVHGFAEQSGGFVEIDSAPGEGTRVRIYLPRGADAPAAPSRPVPRAAELRTGRGRVLVIEDDLFVRELVGGYLEELGCTVLEASDAAAALELFDQNPDIDLLFTDVVLMGEKSGLDVAREIRRRRAVPVVFTSGYSERRARELTLDGAPPKFLAKPYTLAELSSMLTEVLDG